MKKSCALALATLYLVITTSVYTCLVHCTTEYLFATLGIVQQIHQFDKDHEKDDKDDDSNCTNPKAIYFAFAKPNSFFAFQSAIIHIALVQLKKHCFYYIPKHTAERAKWAPANGPPLYI